MNENAKRNFIQQSISDFTRGTAHVCSLPIKAFTKARMKFDTSFKHKLKGDTVSNNNSASVDFLNDNDVANCEYSVDSFFKSKIWNEDQEKLTNNAEEVSREIYDQLGNNNSLNHKIGYANPEEWITLNATTELQTINGESRVIRMNAAHNYGVSPMLWSIMQVTQVVENGQSLLALYISSSFGKQKDPETSYAIDFFQFLRKGGYIDVTGKVESPVGDTWLGLNWFVEPSFYDTNPFFIAATQWIVNLENAKKTNVGYMGTPILTDIHNKRHVNYNNANFFFAPQTREGGAITPASMTVKWENGGVPEDNKGVAYNVTGKRFTNRISKLEISNQVFGSVQAGQVARWDGPNPSSNKLLYDSVTVFDKYHKCYSGTLTSEPYHELEPIADGQVVECRFVNRDNAKALSKTSGYSQSFNGQPVFLNIIAPYDFIRKLNNTLEKTDYNDDIIHTVKCMFDANYSIRDDVDSALYWRFGQIYYQRCDNDIDYVINEGVDEKIPTRMLLSNTKRGIVDVGNEWDAPIHPMIDTSLYDQCIVAGIGEVSNSINLRQMTFNLYLTNHNAIADGYKEFMIPMNYSYDDQGEEAVSKLKILSVDKGELLRPVVQIPNYKGNIKIMKLSSLPAHKISKLPNGMASAVYEIEIPYAVGANSIRTQSVYDNSFYSQVSYTSKYMSAGSWEKDSAGHRKSYNERPVFYGSELAKNPVLYEDMTETDVVDIPEKLQSLPGNFVYTIGDIDSMTAFAARSDFIGVHDFDMLNPYIRLQLIVGNYASNPGNCILATSSDTTRHYNGPQALEAGYDELPAVVGKFDITAVESIKDAQDAKFAVLPDQKIYMSPESSAIAKTKTLITEYNNPANPGQIDCVHHIPHGMIGSLEEVTGKDTDSPEFRILDASKIPGSATITKTTQCVIEGYNISSNQWDRISNAPYDYMRSKTDVLLDTFTITANIEDSDVHTMAKVTIYNDAILSADDINEFDRFISDVVNPTDYYLLNTETNLITPILYINYTPPASIEDPIEEADIRIPIVDKDLFAANGPVCIIVGVKSAISDIESHRFTSDAPNTLLTTKYLDRRGSEFEEAIDDRIYSHYRIRPKFDIEKLAVPVRSNHGGFDMRKVDATYNGAFSISDSYPASQYEVDSYIYKPYQIVGRNAVVDFTLNNFHVISK